MKRLKLLSVFFVYIFASFFYVNGIYGYLTVTTDPKVNEFSIQDKTTYTVYHMFMDLDGTNYTESVEDRVGPVTVDIGETITPPVLSGLVGFTAPSAQTVTINSFSNVDIYYYYPRIQYTLTINDDQYVTSNVPEGLVYYGQEVTLEAATVSSNNTPFVKWTNDVTDRVYTFTMTQDVTIGPIYANSYTITYVPNNGSNSFTEPVIENEPITTFPPVTYNDCSTGSGSYTERGCTYVYEFVGWYKEPNFVTQVDESFVPTEDTTLYAKWTKIFFHNDETVFDGTNYLDTEIALFSTDNARRDFIVTFNYDAVGIDGENTQLLFTDMWEGHAPYPGVSFKYFKNNNQYDLVANVAAGAGVGGKVTTTLNGFGVGDEVVLKRENGIFSYSTDGGNTFTSLNDFSNFSLFFDVPAVFGAGYDEHNAIYRYFRGTLSNMTVELLPPKTYTVHYEANGGTGVMPDQVIELGENTNLTPNNFVNDDAAFAGWNTADDGSGTSYPNNYAITSDLGNANDVITLYAQWVPAEHFFVHYDANGGTGTMADQRFTIGNPAEPLTSNSFARSSYEFRGWNTEPNGTGTHYDNEEAVANLSTTDNDVVTLYAEWWKIQYLHTGDAVFDCTQSTFIDTGVNVFSSTNINKDFEIRFTFKSVATDQIACTSQQPTIFNVKDESNSYMPGFNLRFNEKKDPVSKMTPTYKWRGNNASSTNGTAININLAPVEFIYRRTGGVITYFYRYNGTESAVTTMFNQGSWTLNQPFATNVAFGGYFDGNNQPGRFFKGTLADMIILMDD